MARSLAIRRVTIHPLDIPLRSPFKIATMTAQSAPNVFVSILTEDGLTGWGEASFMQSINGESQATVSAALKDLAAQLIGRSALNVRARVDELHGFLPGQAAAHCALDSALHDLASQAAGLTLVEWLGGEARPLPTDVTIGAVDPQAAGKRADEIARAGHGAIKIKIGTDLSADVARFEEAVEAARRIDDSITIRLDANQGYSRFQAETAFGGSLFEEAEFVEQPLRRHDIAGLKWLSGFSAVPIMADESVFGPEDMARLAAENACPLANIKISKSGGIARGLAAAEVAQAGGITCMAGGMIESRLGVTATAHMAASRPVFQHFDLDAHMEHADDFIQGGITIVRGDVILPDQPGLGAAPDPSYLARFPSIVVD